MWVKGLCGWWNSLLAACDKPEYARLRNWNCWIFLKKFLLGIILKIVWFTSFFDTNESKSAPSAKAAESKWHRTCRDVQMHIPSSSPKRLPSSRQTTHLTRRRHNLWHWHACLRGGYLRRKRWIGWNQVGDENLGMLIPGNKSFLIVTSWKKALLTTLKRLLNAKTLVEQCQFNVSYANDFESAKKNGVNEEMKVYE